MIVELIPGRIYQLSTGKHGVFSGSNSRGKLIFHPPGEPDMQSSFIVDPGEVVCDVTTLRERPMINAKATDLVRIERIGSGAVTATGSQWLEYRDASAQNPREGNMRSRYPLPAMTPERKSFERYMREHFPNIDYDSEVTVSGSWLCGFWMAAQQELRRCGKCGGQLDRPWCPVCDNDE